MKLVNRTVAIYLLLGAALLIFPLFRPPSYFVHLLSWIFMYSILSESFNIIAGIAGQFSLGHAVFFGIGAYTVALLTQGFGNVPLGFILMIIAAGVMGMLFSLPVGYVALRTRAIYFAMVTLAISEVTRIIFVMTPQVGGAIGLPVPQPFREEAYYYYLFFITFIITVLATYYVERSRLGLSFKCIRDDELAAGVIGINTFRQKMLAFAISSIFPALSGGIYAFYISYITPDAVFSPMISISMQVMSILGGLGTVAGPILGSIIIEILGEYLLYSFPEIHLLADGIIMIVVMIFMPGGVIGIARSPRVRKWLRLKKK